MDFEKLEVDVPLSTLTLSSPGESMKSDSPLERQPWKDRRELKRLGKLGFGGSARVYKCHNIIDGKDYAVKQIPYSEDDEEKVFREARIFSKMEHQHILRYYQAWTEDDHGKLSEWSDDCGRSDLSNGLVLYIAMEYCPRTLAAYLSERESVECEVSLKMFRQVLSATEYMHRLGVVHVDLHPKNIFLDASGNIKVGDFDCAVSISDGPVRKPEWLGPMYHRCSQDEYLFVQTDVYSLGVLMVELLWKFETGFERHSILTGFKEGKVPRDWEYGQLTYIVTEMLSPTFYDRPTIERVKLLLDGVYLG